MSTYSMEHGTYYSSVSPETKRENIPDTDLYPISGWTDNMFLPGPTPFSPIMSDTNQNAYAFSNPDVSFPSLGPSVSQEMPMMDVYQPSSWSSVQTNYNFFAEPNLSDTEMFVLPAQGIEISQPLPTSWHHPAQPITEPSFSVNTLGQEFVRMDSQTAGFVGNTFAVASSPSGYSNSNTRAGHVRVDSLYAQACPPDAAVSYNHVPLDNQTSDVVGPRRMTVPVTFNGPIQASSRPNFEQDVPYGAPIQQYRTYSGYADGRTTPFAGHAEIPILTSNASVSSVGSVAASGFDDVPCSPAPSTATTRTRTEDTDGRARTDPLYSVKPGKDGNYRCPFLEREGCQHKTTKLKCNYDKYIDSHIKPFRCKHHNCNNNRFSSTACLLRHEREAHGLHGHGNKPFLCEFQDCERSSPDNGFPRSYNLFDHMKRVHGYRPEKATKASSGQAAGRTCTKSQDKVKKRETAGKASHQRSASSVKKETSSPGLTQRLGAGQHKQQMTAQWQAQVNEMQKRSRQSG